MTFKNKTSQFCQNTVLFSFQDVLFLPLKAKYAILFFSPSLKNSSSGSGDVLAQVTCWSWCHTRAYARGGLGL